MQFHFHKYQGTGNDFVLIDDRQRDFPHTDAAFVQHCCDRRFGIGADGLILVQTSDRADFKMVYYNADGRESTLCGNGARCTVAFAASLGLLKTSTTFEAIDGVHTAQIQDDKTIALRMHDLVDIYQTDTHSFLDTGSPHHVELVDDLAHFPVVEKGRAIRYAAPYNEVGSNVNFVEQLDATTFAMRTYERGVEDETLSCGTGATAVALAMHHRGLTTATSLHLKVQGGTLTVHFVATAEGYREIDLCGPAELVYTGSFSW